MEAKASDLIGCPLSDGRYLVGKKLGEGGMGFVYRARDNHLETDVVIKVPRRALLDDPDAVERFARENRSLVQLAHPHIVKIIDVGEQDGLPFAVMQYLSGGSLEDRLDMGADGSRLRVSLSSLGGWLSNVAKALDFIHTQGYVHRDVKPANILFDQHANVFLSDFGVAKALASEQARLESATLTGAGLVLGTPQYMAPEVIMGLAYDGRADQYALAVMVHELLAGRLPFSAPTPAALLVEHSTKAPPSLEMLVPNVPSQTAATVLRGLAKSPEQRFPNCLSFAESVLSDVEQQATTGGRSTIPPVADTRLRPPSDNIPSVVQTPPPLPTQSNTETTVLSAGETVPRTSDTSAGTRRWFLPKRWPKPWKMAVGVGLFCLMIPGLFVLSSFDRTTPPIDEEKSVEPAFALPKDTVAPKIKAWNNLADQLDTKLRAVVPDVLAEMNYDSTSELERGVSAELAQHEDQVISLEKDLKGIRKSLDTFGERLDKKEQELEIQAETTGKPIKARLDVIKERRAEIQDEERVYSSSLRPKLLQFQRRLKDFRYDDNGVEEETELLKELKSVVSARSRQPASEKSLSRAEQYLKSPNESLVLLAAQALARNDRKSGIERVIDLLKNPGSSKDNRARLCWSLVVSGDARAVSEAVRYYDTDIDLLADVDENALLRAVETSPELWKSVIPSLIRQTEDASRSKKLFELMCRVHDPSNLPDLERVATAGSLANQPDFLVSTLLETSWKEGLILVRRVLQQHRDLRLNGLTTATLDRCLSEDPATAYALGEHLLSTGTKEQVEWAIDTYSSCMDDSFSATAVANRIKDPMREPKTTALNRLLSLDTDKSLAMAEGMLKNVSGIDPAAIDISSIGSNACNQPSLCKELGVRLWQAGPDGQGWVLTRLLGLEVAREFHKIRQKRSHQRVAIETMLKVLSQVQTERDNTRLSLFSRQVRPERVLLVIRLSRDVAKLLPPVNSDNLKTRTQELTRRVDSIKLDLEKSAASNDEYSSLIDSMKDFLDSAAKEASLYWSISSNYTSFHKAMLVELRNNSYEIDIPVQRVTLERISERKTDAEKLQIELSKHEAKLPRFDNIKGIGEDPLVESDLESGNLLDQIEEELD